MAAPDAQYRKAIDTHRSRLVRLSEDRGVAELKSLYDAAQDELESKLRGTPGGRKTSMTAHQQRMLLSQAKQGALVVARKMAGELGDISEQAQVDSLRGLSGWLKKMEGEYTGSEIVLPIDEASRFWGVIDKRRSSLLKQHATSMARYGASTVQTIEQQLALSLATGETLDGAVSRVREAADTEWWKAERIARTECLPADTFVSGAVVRAAHRRWYEGHMVEVVTERGRKFSATPNHPMLSRRGWVGAGDLAEGDDLVCYVGKQHAGSPGHEHVAGRPSTISQVFDTVAAVGVRQRRRTAEPDFHGDGMQGEVDVLVPDRELALGHFAAICEPLAERVFSPANLPRARFCSRCTHLLPVNEECGLCVVARRDSRLLQTLTNQLVAGAERLCQAVRAFAGSVAGQQLFGRYVLSSAGVWSPAVVERVPCFGERAGHPGRRECLADPHFSESGDARHGAHAQAGEVEFDRVLSVRVWSFCGHVFNLSTVDGYFTINGIYTGNTAWAYNATHADGIEEVSGELDDIYQRWTEHVTDDLVPMDDRVGIDSIVMHGQVAKPGELFTMPEDPRVSESLQGESWQFPPNRPNDRSVLTAWRPHWGGLAWVLVGPNKRRFLSR